MPVLINFKICDNAKECGGVCVCPTGALSYNDDKNAIVIDNTKCISCHLCEKECPIGAIQVAKSEDEYNKIKKEIDNDIRTTKDLFVDRYGSTPLSDFFTLDYDDIKNKINANSLVMIELYNDDSIQCLLKSIPIKDITKDMPDNTLFYKVYVDDRNIDEYGVKELPSLLIFNNNKLIGTISGYYTNEDKKTFIEQINSILYTK